jgi:hypothetical protein
MRYAIRRAISVSGSRIRLLHTIITNHTVITNPIIILAGTLDMDSGRGFMYTPSSISAAAFIDTTKASLSRQDSWQGDAEVKA